MKTTTTISNLIRGLIGGILLILFMIPATGSAQNNIVEQHGTLHKLIGFPSISKSTGWLGGTFLSVGAYVEFGFSVGGTLGEVSLNGKGVLSKNGSNWDLWFLGTTGEAKMNFGFQTVAQYKVTALGHTYQDNLPILPNLDFNLHDSKNFTPYLLGGSRNVELSDAIQPQEIISYSPGIPGVANIHIGLSLATNVTSKISGGSLNTNRGIFTSDEQHLQQDITSHYFTVSGIQERLSDNLTMYFTPNGTIGVKFLFYTKDIDMPIFTFRYAVPTINFNTSPSQSITFSIPQPKLSVKSTDIDLGTYIAGTSFSKTFTVKNIGESGSTLTGNTSKNTSWISAVSPASFSLGVNQSQTITIQGTFPSISGFFNGNISVTSNGGNQNINVHGVVAVKQYTVNLSSNPSNGGTTSGGGTYDAGSSVTVTATANSGYRFKNWTENGNVVSNSSRYSFTIQGNRTLVANFTKQQYTVNLSSNPSNGGTTSGGGTYNWGSSVTVTATANSGYKFKNWTENGNVVSNSSSYSFTIQGNRTLVANFTKQQYTVNLSSNPSNGGATSGGGTFNWGSSVTVTATANSGYKFKNWTENGNVVSNSSSYSFTIQSNRTLVANFIIQKRISIFQNSVTLTGLVGGQQSFNITSNISWQVTGVQDWFSVNPSSGSNNATITVKAEKPWPGSDRTATLTIGNNTVSKQITVKQTSLTGISNTKLEKSIRIYPNPAKTALYIGFNDNSLPDITVSVYDGFGKLLYSKHYDKTPLTVLKLDLANYNKGVYYIRFRTDKGMIVRKFVVLPL